MVRIPRIPWNSNVMRRGIGVHFRYRFAHSTLHQDMKYREGVGTILQAIDLFQVTPFVH